MRRSPCFTHTLHSQNTRIGESQRRTRGSAWLHGQQHQVWAVVPEPKSTFEDWVEFFVEQDERTFWLALKTPTRVDIWDAALDIHPGAFVVKGVPGTNSGTCAGARWTRFCKCVLWRGSR